METKTEYVFCEGYVVATISTTAELNERAHAHANRSTESKSADIALSACELRSPGCATVAAREQAQSRTYAHVGDMCKLMSEPYQR